MANNRNDHEEPDDSEYRFSDDEVSYEIDESTPKTATIAESKPNVFKNAGLKRILISLVIFIILVTVVYRMLAPTAPVAPEIAAVPEGAATRTQLPVETISKRTSVVHTQSSVNQAVTPPYNVTTPLPTPPTIIGGSTVPITTGQMTTPINNRPNETFVGEAESKIATMAAENEKRINQLYNDYNQKLNDYAVQNKQLQDQVQMLTAKVGSVETQISQLVQVLIRQKQSTNSEAGQRSNLSNSETPSAAEPVVSYNVQAIIPGRAWLKSDNGETVTVAEGDMIKGLGRVTKIDPYDGIVEVNTGNKALSLSYGGNG